MPIQLTIFSYLRNWSLLITATPFSDPPISCFLLDHWGRHQIWTKHFQVKFHWNTKLNMSCQPKCFVVLSPIEAIPISQIVYRNMRIIHQYYCLHPNFPLQCIIWNSSNKTCIPLCLILVLLPSFNSLPIPNDLRNLVHKLLCKSCIIACLVSFPCPNTWGSWSSWILQIF